MRLTIGRFQVRVQQLPAFLDYVHEVVKAERQVDGCLRFEILQDVTEPDHFVMLEQWRDQDALNHHLGSEAYARNSAKMESFFATEAQWLEYDV